MSKRRQARSACTAIKRRSLCKQTPCSRKVSIKRNNQKTVSARKVDYDKNIGVVVQIVALHSATWLRLSLRWTRIKVECVFLNTPTPFCLIGKFSCKCRVALDMGNWDTHLWKMFIARFINRLFCLLLISAKILVNTINIMVSFFR